MPSTKAKRIGKVGVQALSFLSCTVFVVCAAKSSVSGLGFGHVDKLACGLCSDAFGASSFIGIV